MTKEQWLLCAPKHFDVQYEINPWMDKERAPDKVLAERQWHLLVEQLRNLPIELQFVEQGDKWPDMVFTANAGLAYGNKLILSAFRHGERQGEAPLFEQWFAERGYDVIHLTSGSFEGEGDALFAGDKLFCGYGFRSDRSVYEEIARLLNLDDLILCHLVNPSFYHLDTCFCPINESEALCVIEAFDTDSIERMERAISLIPVGAEDAAHFACNAVVVGREVILPAGCRDVEKVLAQKGYQTHAVEMSEFMKAGGAAKCLSLRLCN